jgi:hypothetical protein
MVDDMQSKGSQTGTSFGNSMSKYQFYFIGAANKIMIPNTQDAQISQMDKFDEIHKMESEYHNAHPEIWKQKETFLERMAQVTDWKQAHQLTQEFIQATQQTTLAFDYQQRCAVAMLNTFLLHQQPTGDVQQAVEYYVTILLTHKGFDDIVLLSKSLLVLRGLWGNEKIIQTSQEVRQRFRCNQEKILKIFTEEFSKRYTKTDEKLSMEQVQDSLTTHYRMYIQQFPHGKLHPLPTSDPKTGVVWVRLEECQGSFLLKVLIEELGHLSQKK